MPVYDYTEHHLKLLKMCQQLAFSHCGVRLRNFEYVVSNFQKLIITSATVISINKNQIIVN
jgi:hypothetical protein